MRLVIIFTAIVTNFAFAQEQSDFSKTTYVARDFTAENLFTEGIEGPKFDKKGNLYVVNFQKNGTIGWVHADGTVELFVTLPEHSTANAIQFDSKGTMLLADYTGHNILKVDMNTKAITPLVHNDAFNQPNDICINKKGQIFASDPKWSDGTGQVWRIEPDGKTELVAANMGTANGIELSPNEKILYVNESIQKKVWSFDVDEKGNLSNKKLFYEFPDFGMDGMKCDTKGNLYICRYDKGTIAILSPSGQLIREVTLKGKKVSNIIFGDKDRKTCYVTLQDRKGMEKFRSEIAGKP